MRPACTRAFCAPRVRIDEYACCGARRTGRIRTTWPSDLAAPFFISLLAHLSADQVPPGDQAAELAEGHVAGEVLHAAVRCQPEAIGLDVPQGESDPPRDHVVRLDRAPVGQ